MISSHPAPSGSSHSPSGFVIGHLFQVYPSRIGFSSIRTGTSSGIPYRFLDRSQISENSTLRPRNRWSDCRERHYHASDRYGTSRPQASDPKPIRPRRPCNSTRSVRAAASGRSALYASTGTVRRRSSCRDELLQSLEVKDSPLTTDLVLNDDNGTEAPGMFGDVRLEEVRRWPLSSGREPMRHGIQCHLWLARSVEHTHYDGKVGLPSRFGDGAALVELTPPTRCSTSKESMTRRREQKESAGFWRLTFFRAEQGSCAD